MVPKRRPTNSQLVTLSNNKFKMSRKMAAYLQLYNKLTIKACLLGELKLNYILSDNYVV